MSKVIYICNSKQLSNNKKFVKLVIYILSSIKYKTRDPSMADVYSNTFDCLMMMC